MLLTVACSSSCFASDSLPASVLHKVEPHLSLSYFSLPFSCKISTCKTVLSPALTARAGSLAGISSPFCCCCRQSLHPVLVAQKAQQSTELSVSHSRAKPWGLSTGRVGLITLVCAERWGSLITQRDMEERAKQ